jgi:hypothetical protein
MIIYVDGGGVRFGGIFLLEKECVMSYQSASRLISLPSRFHFQKVKLLMLVTALCLASAMIVRASPDHDSGAFLPAAVHAVSTVPANGDGNPYGVAFVPPGFPNAGGVNVGDILVSNFNNSGNTQGTGTTIVRIPVNGTQSPFFQGTAPLGLTTALNILSKGFVLVGNFPAPCGSASPGSILVIDSSGNQLTGQTISGPSINGPWDSALFDEGNKAKFFVSNANNGTVVRLDLDVSAAGVTVAKTTQIASGYTFACDPVTFVDAPTGLVYDAEKDVLYVASTADNAVFEVWDAGDTDHDHGTGRIIYQDNKHLHGPLGMAMAPNGHLIVSNNDAINPDANHPSEYTEFTISGEFIKQTSVDPNPGGSFGLAVMTHGEISHLAAIDDNINSLLIWTLPKD